MVSRHVDLGGPVHYVDFGGEGPEVVLVHGLGGAAINWMDAAPQLARRARVRALDLAGFGRTPLAGRSADIESNRSLLDRFVREVVGGPVILGGNSQGGTLALLQAAAAPDTVRALLLVDAATPRPRSGTIDPVVLSIFAAYAIPGVGEAFVRRRLAQMGPEKAAAATMRLCCVDTRRLSPTLWEAHMQLARERFAEGDGDALRAYLQSARTLLAWLRRRPQFEVMVRSIKVPALMIHGEMDRLIPLSSMQALAQLRPDWTPSVLAGIGHTPMMEAPNEFSERVLTWLSSNGLLDAGPSAPPDRAAAV